MENHWEALPYGSQQRLPITACIPYFFRWKILAVKLLLADLKVLADKYEIKAAEMLSAYVKDEAEELCIQLAEEINIMQNRRSEYGKEKTAIQRSQQT